MVRIKGFRYRSTIHKSATSVVYRAVRDVDSLPVVIKTWKQQPKPDDLDFARTRREHEILTRVKSDHVVSCLGFKEESNQISLILDDSQGESLDKLIELRPLTYIETLEIALQAAMALVDIHAAGIVHGSISPSNLIWNSRTGKLKIIDFSNAFASWLPATLNWTYNLSVSKLKFQSPEQTGRFSRLVDHRSDFYSLGATIYYLLTKEPPFNYSDPLEIAHAHIARTPTPPCIRDSSLPLSISSIVMKLLDKLPEQRYQSARGIRDDLQYVFDHARVGRMAPKSFEPGVADVPEIFGISSKLYGRSEHQKTLTQIFSRTASSSSAELVLVSGPSGVGKSSLVYEFSRQIVGTKATFAAGKFDQITRKAPYSAIAEALQQILSELLETDNRKREQVSSELKRALGKGARIITDLVPQFENLIGAHPPLPTLAVKATQNRFTSAFKQFIAAFTSTNKPLILFLDDLQWADWASLKLIVELTGDPSINRLLVIGSYRSEEINTNHMIAETLERLKNDEPPPIELELTPLGYNDVADLLSDSFSVSHSKLVPLAKSLVTQTNGNPFAMHSLLAQLHDRELLWFDSKLNRWHWDYDAISSIGHEYPVVEYINSTIKGLPIQVKEILFRAACLGQRFSLQKLSVVTGKTTNDILNILEPAMRSNLISAAVIPEKLSKGNPLNTGARLGFVHDQVQKITYEMLPPEDQNATHLDIGRRLLDSPEYKKTAESGFEAIGHLNQGSSLIGDAEERFRLAKLNLDAGTNAKMASAFGTARYHFEMARTLLSIDSWSREPRLTRKIFGGCAECEFLLGDTATALTLIQEALGKTHDPIERAKLHQISIVHHTLQGEYEKALDLGQNALQSLGINFPSPGVKASLDIELEKVKKLDLEKDFPKISTDRHITDEKVLAAMSLLTNLLPPSDFTDADLNSWIAVKMVNLSQEFGYSPESAKGFANFGNVLALQGEYRIGWAFGNLAKEVIDHFDDTALKPRILYTPVTYLNHWVNPLRESEILGDQAFKSCVEAGELQYAGYVLAFHKTMNEGFTGERLKDLLKRLNEYYRYTSKTRNNIATSVVLAFYNVITKILNGPNERDLFDSDIVSEAEFIQSCERHGNHMALCMLDLLQAHAIMLRGDYRKAHKKIISAEHRIRYVSTTMPLMILPFVASLILSAMYNSAEQAEADGNWTRLLSHGKKLERWRVLCPENFEGPSLLVQAEIARLGGREFEAMRLFDGAIASKSGVGLIPVACIANERAGRFWNDLDKPDFAQIHLRNAAASYIDWGANWKAHNLAEEFSKINIFPIDKGRTESGETKLTSPRSLDLDAVTKMSQAIAGELRLERLLASLVKLLTEVAGAQRVVLFLSELDGLRVEAMGDVSGDKPVVLQSTPLSIGRGFPHSVINFVAAQKQKVVLEDACRGSPFSYDDYVEEHRVKSILCMPIVQQQNLVGVVYLENRLASGVFTSDRVRLIQVLSAVAAIAINNARMFSTVERKVEDRTVELLEASRIAETARQEAEFANSAKSGFLANMSHELRTPLNAVLGYTQLILDGVYGKINSEARDALTRVDHNGRHLLELINEVLDLSKIESGSVSLSIGEFSLMDVVHNVIDSLQSLADRKKLSLTTSSEAELPNAVGDEHRITQVLMNLVGNAIKYTDEGLIGVSIYAVENFLEVSVSDTGIGISENDQKIIFDEFQRVGSSTRQVTGGTGLGLAIARRLIVMHGGEMNVESKLGSGSKFSFKLPVATGPGVDAT